MTRHHCLPGFLNEKFNYHFNNFANIADIERDIRAAELDNTKGHIDKQNYIKERLKEIDAIKAVNTPDSKSDSLMALSSKTPNKSATASVSFFLL